MRLCFQTLVKVSVPIIVLTFFPFPGSAVVPDLAPCIVSLETHFFEQDIVFEAFSMFNIPQGVWTQATLQLQEISSTVPSRMKKKTAHMVPNPIEYPMQEIPAAKIMISVLYDVFIEVMRYYYVDDQPRAGNVFNYILSRQSPKMIYCFGDEVTTILPKIEY